MRAGPGKANRLSDLVAAMHRHTDARSTLSTFATEIDGFTIIRSDHELAPSHRIFRPALCITAQGAKWTMFGQKRFEYPAGKALVVSVDLPSRGTISAASRTEPFLGAVIEFDLAIMQDVIEQLGEGLNSGEIERAHGVFITDLDDALADCVLRSLRLLDAPEAIPILYPGIMREICDRLLTGTNGKEMLSLVSANGCDQRVIRSIHYLRDHFAESVRIEQLAKIAHMSPGTLHRQFKAVTAMTPLQYQKQTRLLEARRLMISSDTNVETAATRVGYESPSQFSRDYSRMFGKPPRRDISGSRPRA